MSPSPFLLLYWNPPELILFPRKEMQREDFTACEKSPFRARLLDVQGLKPG
jgi:hypothetical protein